MSKIDDSTYEFVLHKSTVKHDLPIQIGFWVYSLTKLRMLQFYCDFLVKFFDSTKFKLAQMDTDSLYFGISGKALESILKPEMTKKYYEEPRLWLPSEHWDNCFDEYVSTKAAKLPWTLKPCCEKQLKFDECTPGLFKLEFKGKMFCRCVISCAEVIYLCWR